MGNAGGKPTKDQMAEDGQTQESSQEINDSRTPENKSRCAITKISFMVLSAITTVICVAVIAVSVSTAIATKMFSIQQSGRLVAMIILAVTAAIALSMVIYAILAIFKKHSKPLHAAVVVLVVLGVIQAIICAVSVNLTIEDEDNLGRALLESFKMAREENPRHVKLWSTTQSDLRCCGLYSPRDYNSPNLPEFFPPDVPISCCPSFNSSRSELVQEREREKCKAKKEYYSIGCLGPVLTVFRDTASLVMCVTIAVIVLEIILAALGTVITRNDHNNHRGTAVEETEAPKSKTENDAKVPQKV